MIADPAGTTALSSMGWVEGDALWRFDAATNRALRIPLGSGAKYASLHAAGGERFVVAHHFEGRRFELSVRSFAAPDVVLARASLDQHGSRVDGDPSAWADVPRLYVEHLLFPPWDDAVLLTVAPDTGTLAIARFGWYDDSYDKLYQGVLDVLALDERHAIVSVQRSSRLILIDAHTGERRDAIDLGGGSGNPRFALREGGAELWASDYDTLTVVSVEGRRILRRARLQDAPEATRDFIGDFAFTPDRGLCAVARPASGDVVGVDLATLEIRSTVRLGRQPLELAAFAGGRIVARDWKTGDLLQGTLEGGLPPA